MAAPKRQGLLFGKGPHTCFGRGVRESRSPPCRRAQPAVPFAVPEERRERDEVTCAGTESVGGTARTAGRNHLIRRRTGLHGEQRTINKDTSHGGYSRKAW